MKRRKVYEVRHDFSRALLLIYRATPYHHDIDGQVLLDIGRYLRARRSRERANKMPPAYAGDFAIAS